MGKYIRENLSDVFFMFQKLCVCWNDYGKIKEDLKYIYEDSDTYDFYDDKDKETIIEEITNINRYLMHSTRLIS